MFMYQRLAGEREVGIVRVLLVGCGGTIATRADAGVTRVVGIEDATGATRESVPHVDVHSEDLLEVNSRAIRPVDMWNIAKRVRHADEEGYDGVVITHGTDTLEETAYALALQVSRGLPVVLTGAMRLGNDAGADGPANLQSAIRVAVDGRAGRLGPVAVLGDEIHLARWVMKTSASKVSGFSSPGVGPAGHVVEGQVTLHWFPETEEFLGLPEAFQEVRVEVIQVTAGADGFILDAIASDIDALVIAGTGGGHVPPAMVGSIQAVLEQGTPVVIATRCLTGPMLSHTYSGLGSERNLRDIGVITAGEISPLKARLRLITALSLGLDPTEAFPVP